MLMCLFVFLLKLEINMGFLFISSFLPAFQLISGTHFVSWLLQSQIKKPQDPHMPTRKGLCMEIICFSTSQK